MKYPDERKIQRYKREDPKFDPVAYRKAWHRAGEIMNRNKESKK